MWIELQYLPSRVGKMAADMSDDLSLFPKPTWCNKSINSHS